MVEVWFVDGDKEQFETKYKEFPYTWISDQKAYLIQSVDEDIIIPSSFVKLLKHTEVG